ncbi:MAG: LCP family protein [Clostridia bacterium]|nr:LCP family protein [Clostridia bacterium]
MKSVLQKITTLLLSCALVVPVASSAITLKRASKTKFTYLLAGVDDAASNTDVLMLVTFDSARSAGSVIQIPRDTYFESDGKTNKINHVYPSELQAGKTPRAAMESTAELISDLFSVEIDGFVSVTTAAFRDFVDSIGGVLINMPAELEFFSGEQKISLKKGENLLDADTALAFVRHRKSYPTADLGRLNAQKIFLDGLYYSATKRAGYDTLLSLVSNFGDGVVTNVSIIDVLIMIFKHSSKFRDAVTTYLTLPGEPVEKGGVWYYVPNKIAATLALNTHVGCTGEFDSEMRLLDTRDEQMLGVYGRRKFRYPEYIKNDINYVVTENG